MDFVVSIPMYFRLTRESVKDTGIDHVYRVEDRVFINLQLTSRVCSRLTVPRLQIGQKNAAGLSIL